MKVRASKSEVSVSKKALIADQSTDPATSTLEILSHDMQSSELQLVIECAVRKYSETKEKRASFSNDEHFFMAAAQEIGECLDEQATAAGPWQIFLGKHYGSFVTHESFYFVNFKYDELWFTLYVSS